MHNKVIVPAHFQDVTKDKKFGKKRMTTLKTLISCVQGRKSRI